MARTLLLAIFTGLIAPALCRADDKPVCRIGVPRSIFRDVPPALITFAGQPFKDLMKAQSGVDGEVVHALDAMTVAEKIDSGKLELGVFFGHEFAWARDKYADLEPIVCTVPRPNEIRAIILVRYDCTATNLAELKDEKLALAAKSRDHARLFLDKRRRDDMGDATFRSIEKTDTVHEAIEKVIEGEAAVTVADSAAWSYYQKLYPGRATNLKVLASSDRFPPTVIACKKGQLDAATIKSIQDGLLTAHKNAKAARLMSLIRIDRFERVAANYNDLLKACLKSYPKPAFGN